MPERARAIAIVEKPGLRKRHPVTLRATAGVLLLTFVTMVLHGNWLLALVLVCGGLGVWQMLEAGQHARKRDAVLREVEEMTDSEFLRYAAELLQAQGYGVLKTTQTDESHGNLLVMHEDKSLACRVIRAHSRLGKAELVQTLSRMKLQGCTGSMILTTRMVSWAAARYARRVACIIIGGQELVRLIGQYRKGHRVYIFQYEETAKQRRRK